MRRKTLNTLTKPRLPRGKPVATVYTGDPESKTDRDLRAFAHLWAPAFRVFEEATIPARRAIVQRIANDLVANIRFAGRDYDPPPISLIAPTGTEDPSS